MVSVTYAAQLRLNPGVYTIAQRIRRELANTTDKRISQMNATTSVLIALCTAVAACTEPLVPVGSRDEGVFKQVVDVPPVIRRELDLLFVVDNTETMAQRQLELQASFGKLMTHLQFADGGRPNLHIGVISSDVGAGGEPVAGCSITGDRGTLQAQPRRLGCTAPDDQFLRDNALYDPERVDLRDTNFGNQELGQAFQCISELGTEGCTYEQPLEAMKLALDGFTAENVGFIRPGATLGIVILTDEDDCSAFDSGLFSPSRGPVDGARSKFRCFRHGVECGGDDVRIEGEYSGCTAKKNSDYLTDVSDYADFLDELKFDPDQVVVTGMIGDSRLVEVQVDLDDQPQLVPSCENRERGTAYPAIRLQQFLDDTNKSGGRSEVASLCDGAPLDALADTARDLRKALGTRCLDGNVRDVEPDVPGMQLDCRVYDQFPDGSRIDIPACSEPYALDYSQQVPCFAMKTGGTQCGDFRPHQLALQVWRGSWEAVGPPNAHTIGECLVEP